MRVFILGWGGGGGGMATTSPGRFSLALRAGQGIAPWGQGCGGGRTWGKFGYECAAESFKPWTCLRQNDPFFRVFVTQSPTRQFSLSSGNGPPVLGGDINTIEALQALRVISVKFLLVISLLYKTEWSWELRTWSHKMNPIDTSRNSPHYFYWKRIGITNENLNFDVRV